MPEAAPPQPTTSHEYALANPDRVRRIARDVWREGEQAMVEYLVASLAEVDGFPAPHSRLVQRLDEAVRLRMRQERGETAPDAGEDGERFDGHS